MRSSTSLVSTKKKYNTKKAGSHFGGTLVVERREMSFISALSRLPAVKQQHKSLRLQPQTSGHACAPTSQGLPIWSYWLDGMIEVVIRCEPCSQWQNRRHLFAFNTFCCCVTPTCPAESDVFVFVSHQCSPLPGRPKVFYLRTLWHWEVRNCFRKNLQTFQFPLFHRNCICCLATIAYWTFYLEVLRSTGSVSVVQRRNSL